MALLVYIQLNKRSNLDIIDLLCTFAINEGNIVRKVVVV